MQSKIINSDNLNPDNGLQSFPDQYFDLSFADPPYNIGISNYKKFGYRKGRQSFTNYESSDWDNTPPPEAFFEELFRVSKIVIIFGANYFTPYLQPSKGWFVWDKQQPSGISFAQFELIYSNCDTPAQKIIINPAEYKNNVSSNPKKIKDVRIHHCQKPEKLYLYFLNHLRKFYKSERLNVLDTHLGSGASRIACELSGLVDRFTAYEIDSVMVAKSEKYYQKRINSTIYTKTEILQQARLMF